MQTNFQLQPSRVNSKKGKMTEDVDLFAIGRDAAEPCAVLLVDTIIYLFI